MVDAREHPLDLVARSRPSSRRAGGASASTPRSAARPASRSRLASSVLQPVSSSTGRPSYPSWPVAAASTSVAAPAATKTVEGRSHLGQPGRAPGRAGRPGRSRRPPARPRSASVFAFSRRVVGKEAVRTELGRRDADVAHLGEHRLRVVLPAPARDLADTPRDRGAGDPACKVSHRPISSVSSRVAVRGRHAAVEADDAVLAAGQLAGVGDPEGLVGVPDRARDLAGPGDDLGEGGQLGDVRRPEAVHEGGVRRARRGR